MSSIRAIMCRLWALVSRWKPDEELKEELEHHLSLLVEENLRRGLKPEEARRKARLALGGMEQIKEAYHDTRGFAFFESVIRDIVFAIRLMRQSPGFTATALVTLVLGIGANTTIFSIVDAVLLRPLPYLNEDRIISLGSSTLTVPQREFLDVGIFHALRKRSDTIASVALFLSRDFSPPDAAEADIVSGAAVSPSLFAVLGIDAEAGRIFSGDEEQKGKDTVVLIGHDLWQRRYSGDRSILGRNVTLNKKNYTVIGIMPSKFAFPEGKAQLWIPLVPPRSGAGLRAIGRLHDRATPAQAASELKAIADSLDSWGEGGRTRVFASPFHEELSRETRPALTVLFLAASVVLLLSCANLAHLMAARSKKRKTEFAIRMALGASHWTLVRQALIESLFISGTGAAFGFIGSHWAIDLFVSCSPMKLRSEHLIGLDFRVFAFTACVTLMAGAFMGLFAVWEPARSDIQAVLKDAGKASKSGRALRWGNGLLIATQLGIGSVLLVSGALFGRSFIAMATVDQGYEPDGVLAARIILPGKLYPKIYQQEAFFKQLIERLERLPDVEAACLVSMGLPLTGKNYGTFRPEGWSANAEPAFADFGMVSPGFFELMKMHLLHGRIFNDRDTAMTPRVVVINEALARRFFSGLNPVGKTLRSWGPRDQHDTIVGVVADIKYYGPDKGTVPCIYYSTLQAAGSPYGINGGHIVMRTRTRPERLIASLHTQVTQMDKAIIPSDIKTMDGRLWESESVAQLRFYTFLIGGFALSAVLLVLLGIYGVVAYTVSGRTREIGLRIALGAQPRDIYGMVMNQSILPALAGVVVGFAAAWALTRFLSSLLFGIRPHDPAIFVALPIFLMATVLLAAYLPARRAANLDPMTALKEE